MSQPLVVGAFDLEKWMTIPALKWLTSSPMVVKGEFRMPWGVCDLVGVEMAQSRVLARIAAGQKRSIGPATRIALLQLIPDVDSGQWIDLDTLRVEVDAPEASLLRDLHELCRRRFVVRREDGSFQSRKSWAPLHNRIVAVELKLSRIDEVLAQARSHTAFATESYIGLPEDKAERLAGSDRVSELKSAGLGLLSVNPHSAKVLLSASPVLEPDAVMQMHTVERFWNHCVVTSTQA